MATVEYEAKYLEIDCAEMAARISACGGLHIGEHLMRRYVYDTIPAQKGRWIRLRDTGREVTLCVKEISSDEVDGTQETEINVGDFDTTHALLGRAGIRSRSYQENRRDSWLLDGVRLELDSWPLIPPYMEIEGDTADQVWAAADRLGIPKERLTSENTTKIYAHYGVDLYSVSDLRFPLEASCAMHHPYR